MKGLKLMVLALLLVGFDPGIIRPAQGQPPTSDDGEAFVKLLEKHVGLIAQQALTNLLNKQDLIKSCDTSCSRGECLPLSTDLESYNCTYSPDKLDGCNSQTPGQECNNVRTTLLKGYVRTPLNTSNQACEIRKSVCVQRQLDPVFQAAAKELAADYKDIYIHLFFGSVAGDFRYFPGREAVITCKEELYDPRIRPWYTDAIGVAKNMVVLLDNGVLMKQSVNQVSKKSTFTVAKQFAELLLAGSATKGDYLKVISFNSVASLVDQVVLDGNDTSMSLQPLLAKVEGAQEPVDVRSNLTAGLEFAQRLLLTAPDAPMCKIAVVFTDGDFDPSSFNQSALALGVKLFIYAVGVRSTTQNATTQNATCYHFEALGSVALDNPLFGLKAFFSFIAQSRKKAHNNTDKPHWRPVYDSSTRVGLNEVVTVGMPALDDNGQLVGVAGIDVPISALQNVDLSRAFQDALGKRSAPFPNVSGADLCQDSRQDNDTQSCGDVPVAVCRADSSLTNFQLLCCEGCGGSSLGNTSTCGGGGQQCVDPSPAPPQTSSPAGSQKGCSGDCGGGSSAPTKIIVPIVAVVGVAALGVLAWYIRKRYYRDPLPPARPPPSLTPSPPNQSPEKLLY